MLSADSIEGIIVDGYGGMDTGSFLELYTTDPFLFSHDDDCRQKDDNEDLSDEPSLSDFLSESAETSSLN